MIDRVVSFLEIQQTFAIEKEWEMVTTKEKTFEYISTLVKSCLLNLSVAQRVVEIQFASILNEILPSFGGSGYWWRTDFAQNWGYFVEQWFILLQKLEPCQKYLFI